MKKGKEFFFYFRITDEEFFDETSAILCIWSMGKKGKFNEFLFLESATGYTFYLQESTREQCMVNLV